MKTSMFLTMWVLLVTESCTIATTGKKLLRSHKIYTTKNKVKEGSPCQGARDCPMDMYCHTRHLKCLRMLELPASSSATKSISRKCSTSSDCSGDMYCHNSFGLCLPVLLQPTTATVKKSFCKRDQDCGRNQYCHAWFKMCLDVLAIPTLATRKSIVRKCQHRSHCRMNEYCHKWFKMCLVNRTAVYTTQPSIERIDCTRDGDCQTDEYCHNMSHLCLQLRKADLNSPAPSRSSYRCTSDDDCKITEFCHILFSGHRHVARDPSRPVGCIGNRCVRTMQRKNIFGICIPKDMQIVAGSGKNYVLNCSGDKDCGDGMCCLRTIGVCMAYRLPGELCLAEKTQFSCPCYGGFTCLNKGRRWRRRRIERKMKLNQDVRRRINVYVKKGKKYLVGKCGTTSS